MVIRFTAPAEVKGVALLVVNHPDRSSDQWMWTPAIGRDRRIALQDRSTRFFGTDSASKTWKSATSNQYDYKLTGEEADRRRAVLADRGAARGKARSSSTPSSTVWIRKDNYVPAQYENFVKDQLVRRLHQTDIRTSGHLDRRARWR